MESAKAKAWRKRTLGKLLYASMVLGYRESTIRYFERGYDDHGKPVSERSFKRYKALCFALGKNWDWQ